MKKSGLILTALAAIFVASLPKAAFAGSISGVDTTSAMSIVVEIFQVFIGIIGLAAIVHGAYEGVQHRKVIQAVIEVALGLVVCVIAFSANALATQMGIMGALLH